MSTADELRQAADKVRATAKAALDEFLLGQPLDFEAYLDPSFDHGSDHGLPAPLLAWIRLASPALAEPLAAWLEGCVGEASFMTGPDDFGICDEPASVRAALKVARAINGGAS